MKNTPYKKRKSKPIEGIPVFTGKAAEWLIDYLETHTKRTPAQAQKDKEIAEQIKPLKRKERDEYNKNM